LRATSHVDGFFEGKRYLIHNRDPLYTQQFLSMLGEAGIESVKLPPRAPNLNAYAGSANRPEPCFLQYGEEAEAILEMGISIRHCQERMITPDHREAEESL
jgi:hypothetical protein